MKRRILSALVPLTALGCARQGPPPGGPLDRVPPMVVATRPDTFAVVEAFDDPVVIRFHERISERPTAGQLKDAVVVSPETGEVTVGKKGDRLEVRLRGGFQVGYIYRVTVLPVIRDLFQNGMRDPFEFVFSTGPDRFDATVLAGLVRDSITGGPLEGSRVEVALAPAADETSERAARAEGDTPPAEEAQEEGSGVWEGAVRYVARADSGGAYALRYAPEGRLRLRAFQDRNRNGEPDYAEPQADTVVTLSAGDTLLESLSLLPLDTTPPVLARAEAVDSTTVRLIFDDYLRPDDRLETVQVDLTLDEARGPRVMRLLNQVQAARIYQARADSAARADSLRADSLARADSIAREEAARADSAAAVTMSPDSMVSDTVPPDTLVVEPPEEEVPVTDTLVAAVGGGPLQDSLGAMAQEGPSRGEEPERPPPPVIPEGLDRPERPGQSFFAFLREPLLLDTTYQVQVSGVRNIRGTGGGEGATELRMESPPVDSAAVEDSLTTDTTATSDSVVVDTLGEGSSGTVRDTMIQEGGTTPGTVPPDTTTTRPDTLTGQTRARSDTLATDSTGPADTLPPDTASLEPAGGTRGWPTRAGSGSPADWERPVAAVGDFLARGFQWIRGRAAGLTSMPAVTRMRR